MKPPPRPGPARAPHPGGPAVADDATGLPWLRTWRRVYLFVLGCFVLWVLLLVIFGRLFA
jgi:hypothetical protein